MNMRFKPRYGSVNWVANQVLCWGSNTGWDITTDGKIACCRINYDDYVNFEIEILSAEQIEEYKRNNTNFSLDISQKLDTLQVLLKNNLISTKEYTDKRKQILDII